MAAGKYRFRVTVQQLTLSGAEPTESWQTYATLWAARGRSKGSERVYGAAQREGHNETVFRVRYSSTSAAIDPTMRIVDGSRTLNIVAAYPADGKRVEVEIVAREVTS